MNVQMSADAGLVVEGGGMRGQYVSGILHFFGVNGIAFPYVIGVSAGISNAASYVSGQHERNREIFTRFAGTPEYFSWKNWLKRGNPFGMDFIYRRIPEFIPFDFAAFERAPVRFRIGVTDCETGSAHFWDKADVAVLEGLLASSSLPMIGKMARVNGRLYLDGGITAPLPLDRAAADGVQKRVVLLTRNQGFRKKRPNRAARAAIRLKYRHFPALAEALLNQWQTYNRSLDALEGEEAAGRLFVIRPTRPLQVGRYSQDRVQLEALYQNGIADARAAQPALQAFLAG